MIILRSLFGHVKRLMIDLIPESSPIVFYDEIVARTLRPMNAIAQGMAIDVEKSGGMGQWGLGIFSEVGSGLLHSQVDVLGWLGHIRMCFVDSPWHRRSGSYGRYHSAGRGYFPRHGDIHPP